jgi:nucleotide-binding universal stress UspA family protein
MPRAILVPFDGSPCAEKAVPVAVAIARRHDATLHLVTVHEDFGLSLPTALPAVHQAWASEREHVLHVAAARLKRESGVNAKWALLHGRVAPTLANYVREKDIDLVVMATHGRGGVGRAWLGSTADALLRICQAPLLLIRPIAAATTDAFTNVLVAVDSSPFAGDIVDAVAPLCEPAACTLLHVVTPPASYPSHYIADARERERMDLQHCKAAGVNRLDAIADHARGRGLEPVAKLIVDENVATTILREAEQTGATLVAVGTHGRGRVLRAILGSVADKVIRGALVPVLVVPPAAK